MCIRDRHEEVAFSFVQTISTVEFFQHSQGFRKFYRWVLPVSYTHLDVYKRQDWYLIIDKFRLINHHWSLLIYVFSLVPNVQRGNLCWRMRRFWFFQIQISWRVASELCSFAWTAHLFYSHGSTYRLPVSYTHLDVYKRQGHFRFVKFFVSRIVNPVSYTHLDVYKRQLLDWFSKFNRS